MRVVGLGAKDNPRSLETSDLSDGVDVRHNRRRLLFGPVALAHVQSNNLRKTKMSQQPLFAPLIEAKQKEKLDNAARQRWHDNVAMIVAFGWQIEPETHRRQIEHYMAQCAIAIELFSKNYFDIKLLGSEKRDYLWFLELSEETKRQQEQYTHLIDQKADASVLLSLNRRMTMYKKLVRLMSGDKSVRFDTDIESTQEFFFDCVAAFPMLRIMIARQKPEGIPVSCVRLPNHCAVPQRKMLALCETLEALAKEKPQITAKTYIEKIQKALISE